MSGSVKVSPTTDNSDTSDIRRSEPKLETSDRVSDNERALPVSCLCTSLKREKRLDHSRSEIKDIWRALDTAIIHPTATNAVLRLNGNKIETIRLEHRLLIAA